MLYFWSRWWNGCPNQNRGKIVSKNSFLKTSNMYRLTEWKRVSWTHVHIIHPRELLWGLSGPDNWLNLFAELNLIISKHTYIAFLWLPPQIGGMRTPLSTDPHLSPEPYRRPSAGYRLQAKVNGFTGPVCTGLQLLNATNLLLLWLLHYWLLAMFYCLIGG